MLPGWVAACSVVWWGPQAYFHVLKKQINVLETSQVK